jgi:hypothetical protein
MTDSPYRPELARIAREDRARRVESMWRRMRRMLEVAGELLPVDPGTVAGRLHVLRIMRVVDRPGWTIRNAAEASDLMAAERFEPSCFAPQPTKARGGTSEKLAVLAERCERGLELWHPLDGDRRAVGSRQ